MPLISVTVSPPTAAIPGGVLTSIPSANIQTYLSALARGVSPGVAGVLSRRAATKLAWRVGEARRKVERERLAKEKARREIERKAREEAARKARQAREEAARQIREEAIRKRLSISERKELVSEALVRIDVARKEEEERVRKIVTKRIAKEKAKQKVVKEEIAKEKVERDFFIEKKVVETIRRKGREIPITKTVLVDKKGKIIRDATPEEREILREFEQKLRVPEELEKADIRRLEKRATELRQKRLRGKSDVKGELELAGLTAAGAFIGLGLAITQLPKLPKVTVSTIKRYIKDPAAIKEIPEAIRRGGAEFGELLRISPTEALVKIGTEILIMRGIGKALKVTGRLSSKVATKLSPKFRGVAKRTISIPSLQKGKTITIKVSSRLGRGRIPTQLKFGGRRITAVSAQADRLVKFIKSRKIIRKPIPGEAKLTKATKKLLKKFDTGKITSRELIHLDRRIRTEAKKGLLERSFFADPEAVVRKRFLRLGTEKEASLLDTLAGDVTFKTTKPQILIFEKVKVQAFPDTKIFRTIIKKLKTGKTLTQKEGGALVKFQLKKTGKFKPLGFQTTEKEVTLAPGEIIRKEKTVAVTLIDGRRVPIVRVKVIKAKPSTKKLLSKARKGKITARELKTLRKNLKKETRFTTSISDSIISKPRFPLGRKAVSVAIRAKRRVPRRPPKIKIIRRPPKRVPKRKIVRRPPKRIPRRPPKRIPKKIPKVIPPIRRPPVKPPVREPPVRPPVKPPKKVPVRKPPKKPKIVQGYNVYGKYKRKFIKLSKVPLSKKQAFDRGAFAIDKSTANTFKIEGVGKVRKLGKLTKGEKGHFSKTRKKYRGWKIRKGKKITLKDKFIEKRGKPRIDTRGEVKGLSLAKFAKQKGFIGKRITKRKSVRRFFTGSRMKPQMPLRLKKFKKELIKKALRGKKPTRWRFKGDRRLGFRNNEVVEIVKFIPRKPVMSSRKSPQRPTHTKRKATPAQLKALAKGRKILEERRRGR